MSYWSLTNIYQAKGSKNIWTPENLQNIKGIDDEILGGNPELNAKWKEVCYAQDVENSACHDSESLLSPVMMFDGIDISTITQEQIDTKLRDIVDNNWDNLQFFFS
jgi:hypothetical protein